MFSFTKLKLNENNIIKSIKNCQNKLNSQSYFYFQKNNYKLLKIKQKLFIKNKQKKLFEKCFKYFKFKNINKRKHFKSFIIKDNFLFKKLLSNFISYKIYSPYLNIIREEYIYYNKSITDKKFISLKNKINLLKQKNKKKRKKRNLNLSSLNIFKKRETNFINNLKQSTIKDFHHIKNHNSFYNINKKITNFKNEKIYKSKSIKNLFDVSCNKKLSKNKSMSLCEFKDSYYKILPNIKNNLNETFKNTLLINTNINKKLYNNNYIKLKKKTEKFVKSENKMFKPKKKKDFLKIGKFLKYKKLGISINKFGGIDFDETIINKSIFENQKKLKNKFLGLNNSLNKYQINNHLNSINFSQNEIHKRNNSIKNKNITKNLSI